MTTPHNTEDGPNMTEQSLAPWERALTVNSWGLDAKPDAIATHNAMTQVGDDGQPTAAYWQALGHTLNQQAQAVQSIRSMAKFFTALAVIGLVIGVIGIILIAKSGGDTSTVYVP